MTLDDIETRIEALAASGKGGKPMGLTSPQTAAELLALGEQVLEQWILARGDTPANDRKEGFRLLALHRQGAKGEPSFNACRETCRELVYHYNLVTLDPDHPDTPQRLRLATMVARHLVLFVSGKLQVERLGEFCCSSKPVRAAGE